jgi:hypothetical protein
MKKIFALAVSTMLVSFVFAQHAPVGPHPYSRDMHGNSGPVKRITIHDRDEMVANINMRYDARIYDIRHSRILRNAEKRKMIRQLELNRKEEVKAVYTRFDGRNKKRIPAYANNDFHRH